MFRLPLFARGSPLCAAMFGLALPKPDVDDKQAYTTRFVKDLKLIPREVRRPGGSTVAPAKLGASSGACRIPAFAGMMKNGRVARHG